jgi:hypothetical protein
MKCWPALTLMVGLAACGSDPCPGPPPTCPQTVPHYQPDVSNAIQANCTICHFPGGTGASWPLTTYDEVYAIRDSVQSQIASCKMPPPGWPPMTPAIREMVLAWLVCGAPNN